MDLEELTKYYCGFFIERPVGNNAFSFDRRSVKKIYVPPLQKGTVDDLATGDEVVFSEVLDGQEFDRHGLAKMVYMNSAGKDIFIIDNHNHAFFLWLAGLKTGAIRCGEMLVHVDQHTDMRAPGRLFTQASAQEVDLRKAFEYTNFELNVGNFIRPALAMGLFSQVEMIDSSTAFERPLPGEYVLDIDIDIFAPEMAYIDRDFKLTRIQSYLKGAKFITIATSPYFMQQEEAIRLARELLEAL